MSDTIPRNAGDPKSVERMAKAEKRQRQSELSDIFFVMSDPRGRRFIWRLLSLAGIFKTSFTGNSTTFYNEGRRSLGLELLVDVNESCPELYLKAMLEAREKEQQNA